MEYSDAGVNIKLGDDASKVLYEAAKLTWENRKGKFGEVIAPFDDFSGIRVIRVAELPKGTVMNLGFDGVGTKMELGERIGKHDTVAFDLLAMVCDDAVVRGGEPVIVGSILDVKSLGTGDVSHIGLVKQLAVGYINAANAAGVAIINGEIAELGARVNGYGPFNYNWGAGVVWFADERKMFTGREIKAGDKLIGLREYGLRSNGLSLVRKIMLKTHGENWHEQEYNGKNLAELALYPSKIYCKAVVDLLGGIWDEPKAEVHGVVHVTGGGVPGKLGRVLKPSGLGASLDDLFKPCELMHYCQEKGNVEDPEAYRTWNMGQGMIIISPEPENVKKVMDKYNIESKVIGEVTGTEGIFIKSKGIFSLDKELYF
ncbi:MAG: AIR synthase-related protein [Candidatus Nanoarchaeia archaeon]|nr:AIR synthase-related protein [Candidatus Nanoarchaeia archaeon]